MDTDNYDEFQGERSEEADSDKISLDMDMDLKMAQIMAETRKASEAIRQSTEAIRRTAGIAGAGEQSTLVAELGPELPTSDFVLELERLANGLQIIAEGTDEGAMRLREMEKQPELHEAANDVQELFQEMRAQHAALAETVSRFKAAATEADTSMNAFKQTMSRLENLVGGTIHANDAELPSPINRIDEPDPAPEQPTLETTSSDNRRNKRAALEALRDLST